MCMGGNGMPGESDVYTRPFECEVVVVSPKKIPLSSQDVSLWSLGVTEVARVSTHVGYYRLKLPVGEYSVLPVVDGMVIMAGIGRNGQGYANYVTLSAKEVRTYNITLNYVVD